MIEKWSSIEHISNSLARKVFFLPSKCVLSLSLPLNHTHSNHTFHLYKSNNIQKEVLRVICVYLCKRYGSIIKLLDPTITDWPNQWTNKRLTDRPTNPTTQQHIRKKNNLYTYIQRTEGLLRLWSPLIPIALCCC